MSRFARRHRSLGALALALALPACGDDGSPKTLPLDPVPAVVEIQVQPSALTLSYLGATGAVRAALFNTQGQPVTAPRIYWFSTDTSVARVDSAGTVTAVGVGTGGVVAQFLDLADTAEVRVARVPVVMLLSADTLLFTELGRTVQVSARVWDGSGSTIPAPQVTWTSSAPEAVSVDANGVVRAVADGTAIVTATADTVSRSLSVRVASRPATLTVTPARIDLDGISDTARVVSQLRNAAGVSMYPRVPTYVSSDPSVVTVDEIGFVIARKKGTARITITSDTLVRTVPVTVIQTPHTLRAYPDTATLTVGDTLRYAALVRDRFGFAIPDEAVTWSVVSSLSDPQPTAVATIDATGLLTAGEAGAAIVLLNTARLSDTAAFTVRVPASSGPPRDP